MKKTSLLLVMCMVSFLANAQLFTENFATATIGGDLEGYNGWYKCLKAADAYGVSPKIEEGALFYDGYAGTNIGNVAVLDPKVGETSSTQRISTKIIKFGNDTLKPVVGEKIYTAFLVNIGADSYKSQRDFFTYEGSKTSSSTRGRIFAKANDVGDKCIFAISKNSSTSGVYVESGEYATGINHLIVFCYKVVSGDLNDTLSMYIDPDLSKPESAQTVLVAKDTQDQSDYSASTAIGINLRQRGVSAKIGGIRVSKSWNSALLPTGLTSVYGEKGSVKAYGKTLETSQPGNVKVFNLLGSEIFSAKTGGKLETSLGTGLYLVRFVGENGKASLCKIAIK